jgi:hypothetical protein
VKQLVLSREKGSSSRTDGSSWKDGDKQEAVIGTQALSHTHHTSKQKNKQQSLNETLDLREEMIWPIWQPLKSSCYSQPTNLTKS